MADPKRAAPFSVLRREPSRSALALAAFVFAVLLFLGSREPPWGDAAVVHAVADAIVDRGALDIPRPENPTYATNGGRYYAQYGILVSLVQVPGVALVRALAPAGPGAALVRVIASHLATSAATACTAALFFFLALRIGARRSVALGGALTLVFATGLAVYGRSAWAEPVQAACLAALYLQVLRAAEAPSARAAIALGVLAGAALHAKYVFAVCLPGAAACALAGATRRQGARGAARFAAWGALAFAPAVALALAYNHLRSGDAFATGYETNLVLGRDVASPAAWGAWGLLFSPGKSALLYDPPLAIAAAGLFALRRRDVGWAIAAAGMFLPLVGVVARFAFWAGDWAWGPRYLLPVLPIALLPGCRLIERALVERQRAVITLAGAVAAAGLVVQLLGASLYWDHWIRVAQAARRQWLGEPDRRGALQEVNEGGQCDPCFEDLHALHWLPPFQPIVGHAWLARHVARRDPWEVAEADAPWKRATALRVDLGATYPRARLDWWYLRAGESGHPWAARVFALTLLLVAAEAARVLRRPGLRTGGRACDSGAP